MAWRCSASSNGALVQNMHRAGIIKNEAVKKGPDFVMINSTSDALYIKLYVGCVAFHFESGVEP